MPIRIRALLTALITAALVLCEGRAALAQDPAPAPLPVSRWQAKPLRIGLEVSLAGFQAADVATTLRGVAVPGGREANPLMADVVASAPAFIALKAASTALIVASARRMSRLHPKAAFFFMLAANGGCAALAASNYHQLARVRR